MTEHHHLGTSGLVVALRHGTTEDRLDAEDGKQAEGGGEAVHPLRLRKANDRAAPDDSPFTRAGT